MYWYGQFKSGFFNAWTQAGLPSPMRNEAAYTAALGAIHFIRTPTSHRSELQRDPLSPEILDAVYGFGTLFGRTCGCLLGLPPGLSDERSDWCGRFNLGISLFDYLCDESDRAAAVAALPAFRPFLKPNSLSCTPLHEVPPAEVFLNELATGVIAELMETVGQLNVTHCRANLWHTLRNMFEAELAVVRAPLRSKADLEHMRKALRLKSREPFRVMAEWMAYGCATAGRATLLSQSRRLGRALGQCYWLMDDAKDVWTDLESGQWNLFLIHSMALEPRLSVWSREDGLDLRLTQMWERDNLIRRLSQRAVRQVVDALRPLSVAARKREECMGFVAASLARW